MNKIHNTKFFTADNVSKYLDIITNISNKYKNHPNKQILFRGESKDYQKSDYKFVSSAFRNDRLPIDGYETAKNIPFLENVYSFKHEIYHEINDITRKQFLAYSQHHGIRTNLIDISTNPLVTLYFAVESNVEDTGYVYLLNTPVLDITDLLKEDDTISTLDIIVSDDEYIVEQLIKKFWGLGIGNLDFINEYFNSLFDDFITLKYGAPPNTKDNASIYDEMINIVKNDPSDYIKNEFYDSYSEGISEFIQKGFLYLCLLRAYIPIKKDNSFNIDIRLDSLLPMIYKPSMGFKRGINQSGLFLYHNYLYSKGNIVLDKQNIRPNYIIKIKNKGKILEQLNLLNINSKFIYGDHSNIARYIENQHDKIRDYYKQLSEEELSNM